MKISPLKAFVVLGVLMAAFGWLAMLQPANAAPPKQEPPLPQSLSAVSGQSIFAENCQPCHGVTGKGDGPTAASLSNQPPDFTDPATLNAMSPTEIFTVIKEGRMDKMMPPWKQRLSDDQIWNATAYLLTLNAPDTVIERGKTVFNESCATCHNSDGSAADVDFADPTTLISAGTDALLATFRTANDPHADALQSLSDEDVAASVAFARSLSMEMPVPVPHDGTLTGKVINGTTGDPVPDIPLTLYTVSADGSLLEQTDGNSGADGSFKFENLRREHTANFVLEAVYNDVHYFSDGSAVFLPDSTEATLDINVYETTDDPSVVEATTLHRIVAFVPDFVSITDIYVYSNNSDKTFIGKTGADGMPETVRIAVPDGAQEVSFQFSTARQIDGNIYADSRPVTPGTEQYSLAVSYGLPIQGKSVTIKTPLLDAIPAVNLLITDQGETLSGKQLERLQDRTIQGQTYQQWKGENFAAGDDLVMTFDRLNKLDFAAATGGSAPAAGLAASGPDQQYLQWMGLALGVLLIAFVVLMVNRTDPALAVAATTESEKARLVALLRELESMYADGAIDDAVYRRLRTQYRNQLKDILAHE